MKYRSTVASVLALAGFTALASCSGSAGPGNPFTSLAGNWSTHDTVRYAFAYVTDGAASFRFIAGQYAAKVVTVDDSTYTFQWVSGSQIAIDSTAGQPASHHTSPITNGPLFTAVVRADTVVLQGFGRMLLDHATAEAITSQRWLPTPECLVALGPMARSTPTPSCYFAFHWARTS